MDYQLLKAEDVAFRNQVLMGELSEEKISLLRKYGLQCNENLFWERPKDKYPQKVFFSHKFLKKSSIIRTVFYIYELCFAKVKYFEQNWDDFTPYRHCWREGLVECEPYDMEFLKHKYSESLFDLRDLKRITDIKEFLAICDYLDGMKRAAGRLN